MIKLRVLATFFIFSVVFIACENEEIITVDNEIILQPNALTGVDAIISSINENQNYGSEADASIFAVNNEGILNVSRFAIQFDLSELPENAIITKAYLSLYFNSSSTVGTNHEGDNFFIIKRITSPWDENLISWQNQPVLSTTNQITVSKSTTGNQDFTDIDITTLVKDLVFYKKNSYGFFIKLQSETASKAVLFASSDHQNTNYHPKLQINYILK